MTALIRLVSVAVIVVGMVASPAVYAQQPAQQEPQGEFLPLDQLPPQDQLPAAPLLITAYALVGLALGAYLLSLSRRLSAVKQDIERLESDVKRSGRT